MSNPTLPSESPTRDYYFGGVMLKCTPGGRLSQLCVSLKDEFPNLRIEHKREHWYWRALSWLVLVFTFGGNKKFMTHFSTTGPNVVGLSDKAWTRIKVESPNWEDNTWGLLMHEREHLRQARDLGVVLYALVYILPFFPIGFAYGRARMERAGYLQTLRCWYTVDRNWAESDDCRAWWIGVFTGGSYGYMWIFKGQVSKWFDQELSKLQAVTAIATRS